jgi:hypothetical protein
MRVVLQLIDLHFVSGLDAAYLDIPACHAAYPGHFGNRGSRNSLIPIDR